MTIDVDLGRKATKPINQKPIKINMCNLSAYLKLTCSRHIKVQTNFLLCSRKSLEMKICLHQNSDSLNSLPAGIVC